VWKEGSSSTNLLCISEIDLEVDSGREEDTRTRISVATLEALPCVKPLHSGLPKDTIGDRMRSVSVLDSGNMPGEIVDMTSEQPNSLRASDGRKRGTQSVNKNLERPPKRQKNKDTEGRTIYSPRDGPVLLKSHGGLLSHPVYTIDLSTIEEEQEESWNSTPGMKDSTTNVSPTSTASLSVLSTSTLPTSVSPTSTTSLSVLSTSTLPTSVSPTNAVCNSGSDAGNSPTSVITRTLSPSTDSTTTELHDAILTSKEEIPDPIFQPKRLRALLWKIDLFWDIDVVTTYLRKESVFRDPSSTVPNDHLRIPTEQRKKIKALAEYLFAASNLDDAFPLFILVWLSVREEVESMGLRKTSRDLIQCARSALRYNDKALIRALLEQEVSFGYSSLSVRSLEYLELSNICRQLKDKVSCVRHHETGMGLSPSPRILRKAFDDARRCVQEKIRHDRLSSDNIKESFRLADLNELDERPERVAWHFEFTSNIEPSFEEYTLRDVLLASNSLMPKDQSAAKLGIPHLRSCIKHAINILNKPPWQTSHDLWLRLISQHWPECPRNMELALFFDLSVNWSAYVHPYDCHDFWKENSFNNMSTLEIISVLSYLALDGNYIRTSFYRASNDTPNANLEVVTDRLKALLNLEHDELLMGFLWCHVKLCRRRAFQTSYSPVLSVSYRDLLTDTFMRSYREGAEESKQAVWEDPPRPDTAMTEISINPTLAGSISTTSTLSSMRRVAGIGNSSVSVSTISTFSARAITADELAERSSLLSLSDGVPSIYEVDLAEVAYSDDFVPQATMSVGENQDPTQLTRRLSLRDSMAKRNRRVSFPTQVTSSTGLSRVPDVRPRSMLSTVSENSIYNQTIARIMGSKK
jgi:hypothetical protein